jgi:hypothetical protein
MSFNFDLMGAYILTVSLAAVFLLAFFTYKQRTGKQFVVWLAAGLIGILLGAGGAAAGVFLFGYEVREKSIFTMPTNEDPPAETAMGAGAYGGGSGGFGGGGAPGGFGGGGGPGGFGGGGGGGIDPATFFERRDENGDGKLSGEEISERMQSRVGELDKDQDGAVSRDEFLDGAASFGPGGFGAGGPGGGGRGGGRNPEQFVERAMSFDEDGDGKLGEDELAKLAEDFGRPRGPGSSDGGGEERQDSGNRPQRPDPEE